MEQRKINYMVRDVTKAYLEDNYPEFKTHFTEIWKLASYMHKRKCGRMDTKEDVPALSFVDNNMVIQIAQIAIPFLTGIFSVIVADFAYDQLKDHEKVVKQIQTQAQKTKKDMHLKGQEQELADKLLPYIINALLNTSEKRKKVAEPPFNIELLPDDKLAVMYKEISEDHELNQLLNHIENALPNFTSHGYDHTRSIIANFEKIVPEKILNRFSPLEKLIMLCAAWLHDVGMSDFEGSLAECSNEEQRKKLREYIREHHAERSQKYIINPTTYQRFHIGPALARVIGTICKFHVNKYDLGDLKAKWGPIEKFEEYGEIRTRLIAALLRLADALDLGYQRVKETLVTIYNIPKNHVESIPHIKGALLITGVIIRGRAIVVQAVPSSKEQEKWVKFLTSRLEEDFLSVKSILQDRKMNDIELAYDKVVIETLEGKLA